VAVGFESNTVIFGSQYCTTHCYDAPITIQGVTEETPEPVNQVRDVFEPKIRLLRPFRGDIVMFNKASFLRAVKKGRLMVFKASLYDINKAIEAKDLKQWLLEEIVPKRYYEFLPLLNKLLADRLPPHRLGIDHEVRLKNGETPTWGPLYSMSRAGLVILKEWFKENLRKGFICQSSSPFAAPVLFA
jgi:hypothetical protein